MISQLIWFYEHVFNNYDPRTSEWFLVSRPGLLLGILSLYTYFCVSAGPRYMRNKKPYSLRTTLIIYNLIQVLLSIYLVYEGCVAAWFRDYNWTCQPVDYSDSPAAMRVARGVYLYFICKLVELLDTVFFVLRKKERQITFLHLYHHASMPICAWVGVRYFAGGHPTLLGVLNSFVHIFMYTYYMLAAFGPEVQKHLWWKKYLTLLQIVQFLVVGSHSAQMLFTDCNFPKPWSVAIVVDSAIFIYMFSSFYIKNQLQSKHSSRKNHGTDSYTSMKYD